MPTRAYTTPELEDSSALFAVIDALQDGDESDEEVADALTLLAVEPLQQRLIQEIGPEKLSLLRLRREAGKRIGNIGDVSLTVYSKYFHLSWLPHVVDALQVPDNFETRGGHYFAGEEGVLLLLRRYRSTAAVHSCGLAGAGAGARAGAGAGAGAGRRRRARGAPRTIVARLHSAAPRPPCLSALRITRCLLLSNGRNSEQTRAVSARRPFPGLTISPTPLPSTPRRRLCLCGLRPAGPCVFPFCGGCARAPWRFFGRKIKHSHRPSQE